MPRTIFITDGISPVGQATAIRLGRAGWNLVLGGSSLSGLQTLCAKLPYAATLPQRCVPTDRGNILPVLEAAEERFGSLDAVLMNSRARSDKLPDLMAMQVTALSHMADAARAPLHRSGGHFVIAGTRAGALSRRGAAKTIARDAARTLAAGLQSDWEADNLRLTLLEPRGVDGHKAMARRIARVLNGAPDAVGEAGRAAVA